MRTHMFNMRPVHGCAVVAPAPCEGSAAGDETLSAPLRKEAVGQRIVQSMQAHERLLQGGALSERLRSEGAASNSYSGCGGIASYHHADSSRCFYPTSSDLGETAFPDLSYSALAYVLVSLHHLSCAAFRADDLRGAALGVGKALEL